MTKLTLLLLYVAMIVLLVSGVNGGKPTSTTRSRTRTKSSSKPTPNGMDPDYVYNPDTKGNSPNKNSKDPVYSTQNITNSIDAQFDGVLIVKSEQTSCEVVMASDSYGFVAANCVMFKGKILTSLKNIQVAVRGPKLSALYPVDNITIHPDYDALTLANNIAVIKFTSPTKSGIKGKMAAGTSKWKELGYLRRTLSDVSKVIWNEPTYLVTRQEEDASCSLGSPVFSANKKNFICSNSTTKLPVGPSCSLPYGLVYGVVKPNNVAPAAIYSHTVVFGTGLCSNFMKLNYYVQLGSYLSWGAKVAGSTAKVIEDDYVTEKKLPSNSTFSMKGGGPSSVPGVAVYGGNLFTVIRNIKPKPTVPDIDPKPTNPTKPTKPTKSPITVSKTRTVVVTRRPTTTKQTDHSTTLGVITPPTKPKPSPSNEPPRPSIPNIIEVTKLPLPTDIPVDLPTDPVVPDPTSDTDSDSDDSSSSEKPPTDSEKLKETEGMSSKTKILIGVFVGLSVLGIGAFCLYYFYYRRR
ncbi:hypothetical protein GGI09_001374 [Coemansia sp. S100]|nr:hypothetical protein GGI09_001374 [Coemansia sp. S100]KAJ2341810.1 hypothetical protein GGH92_005649 [Coemansia sp. RSA 2673]